MTLPSGFIQVSDWPKDTMLSTLTLTDYKYCTSVYPCCWPICALLGSIPVLSQFAILLLSLNICCRVYLSVVSSFLLSPPPSFILYIGGDEGSNKPLTQRNQFFIGFKEHIRLSFMCAMLQFQAGEVLGFKRKFYGAVNSTQFSFPFHPHKLVTHQ